MSAARDLIIFFAGLCAGAAVALAFDVVGAFVERRKIRRGVEREERR